MNYDLKLKMFRHEFIKKYLKGKRVLDMGFVGGACEHGGFPRYHKLVLNEASFVCGVDIQKEGIIKFSKMSNPNKSHYIHDDALNFKKVKDYVSKTSKFDVVIAGEIIEHLDNPGLFLDKLTSVLKDNGICIITTPNYLCLRNIKSFIFTGIENPIYTQRDDVRLGHVVGFTNFLMTHLTLRKGLKIVDFAYVLKKTDKKFRFKIEKIIYKLFPHLSPTTVYIIKKGCPLEVLPVPLNINTYKHKTLKIKKNEK